MEKLSAFIKGVERRFPKDLVMKQIFISAAACFCLVGCGSTGGSYGPAYGTDLGYRNTKLQHDRFRISYTSRDAYESRDFALLRAAQIADNEGYSHFKVIQGDIYDNGPNPIAANVGIALGGRGYNRSGVSLGVHDVARTVEGRKITETIEVVLLASAPSNDPSVFSAQSVLKNIVPRKVDTPHRGGPVNGTP
jgi:hypothetical protein